jgi:hypothetical protein
VTGQGDSVQIADRSPYWIFHHVVFSLDGEQIISHFWIKKSTNLGFFQPNGNGKSI